MSGIIGGRNSKSGLLIRLGPHNTVSSFQASQTNAGSQCAVETQLVNEGNNQNANGTYTCPADGNYMCMFSGIQFETGGSGNIAVSLYRDGSGIGSPAYSIAGQYEHASSKNVIPCTAGQTLYWKPWSGYRNLQGGYTNITFYLMN